MYNENQTPESGSTDNSLKVLYIENLRYWAVQLVS
jgi:hypothetical protein